MPVKDANSGDPPMETPADPVAAPGHNLPSARNYLHDMRHAAHLFVTSDDAAETHLLSVMEHAYRLRWYREERDAHRDEVDGLLGGKTIADTARTSLFTRLLKLAFHNDQLQDKSRISRCAAALHHGWTEHVPADDLHTFIASKGGIVKCGRAMRTEGSASATPSARSLSPFLAIWPMTLRVTLRSPGQ